MNKFYDFCEAVKESIETNVKLAITGGFVTATLGFLICSVMDIVYAIKK